MNIREQYKLDCCACGETIEVPAGDASAAEESTCPRCGARLTLQWRPQETVESRGKA